MCSWFFSLSFLVFRITLVFSFAYLLPVFSFPALLLVGFWTLVISIKARFLYLTCLPLYVSCAWGHFCINVTNTVYWCHYWRHWFNSPDHYVFNVSLKSLSPDEQNCIEYVGQSNLNAHIKVDTFFMIHPWIPFAVPSAEDRRVSSYFYFLFCCYYWTLLCLSLQKQKIWVRLEAIQEVAEPLSSGAYARDRGKIHPKWGIFDKSKIWTQNQLLLKE